MDGRAISGWAMAPACLLVACALIGIAGEAAAQGRGLAPLPDAEYQALPSVPRFRAFLPPSADLSAWFPPVGDQGSQSSCAAWSTGYYLRSYYENRVSAANAQRPTPFSPAFIYNQLTRGRTDCDGGLRLPDVLNLLKNRGAPPLARFPYREASCAAQPDEPVSQIAQLYRIESWKRLDREKPDDVKGELASGHPVVIAMRLPPGFDGFKGKAVYDDTTRSEDYHAMTLVGYDDARRAFKLINSWGTHWGDDGFAWLSYRAFNADVAEAYSARVAHAAPPAPLPPRPEPAIVPPPQIVVVDPPKPVIPPRPEPPKPAVIEPPKPAVIEPPKPSLQDLSHRIEAMAREMRCADIRASIEGGKLTVSGFSGSEADLGRLRAALASAGADGKLTARLAPWPQCEALLTLAGPIGSARGLNVAADKPNLAEGDALKLRITMPSFPAYLYLSYIQADGQVVHLRRYADQGNKPLPAGASLSLGEQNEFVVSGPAFGQESVVAIASSLPLLAIDRPQTETEREYLSEFRLALLGQKQGSGHVAAALLPLSTAARKERVR